VEISPALGVAPDTGKQRHAMPRMIVCVIALWTACGWNVMAQQNDLAFRLDDNLIRVPILLDGHNLEAALDSGTGSIAIDRAFAVALGIELGPSIGTVLVACPSEFVSMV
jgi:hypothetical protein